MSDVAQSCIVCKKAPLTAGLDLGQQPISSHFGKSNDSNYKLHPFKLKICNYCQIIQLSPPFRHEELIPPYEWITYREPEGHLDFLVDHLERQLSKNSTILGLSFKDQSIINRLSKRGFKNTKTLNIHADLMSANSLANIESVPTLVTNHKDTLLKNSKMDGWDVIIARHVIEHAEDLNSFIHALHELLASNGLLVIEVPDCSSNLERGDVIMLWEEHSAYFTRSTFEQLLPPFGFKTIFSECYPLTFENCLVSISHKCAEPFSLEYTNNESSLFQNYIENVEKWKNKTIKYLQNQKEMNQKIAVFGAGHLTCAFINFYELGEYIDCVIDDNLDKIGLYLPGSNLEICPSSALIERGITICLLGLSIELEEHVIRNNKAFEDTGGSFLSIFASSNRSIRKFL